MRHVEASALEFREDPRPRILHTSPSECRGNVTICAWEGCHCPRCGLTVTQSGASCPLCQASLIRVNARRVLLWSAVVVESLLILVLHFRAGAVHLLILGLA